MEQLHLSEEKGGGDRGDIDPRDKQQLVSIRVEDGSNDPGSQELSGAENSKKDMGEEDVPALTSSAIEARNGEGSNEKLDQEHSPSSQKRARGRRKKFKPSTERTDVAS